MTGTINSGGVGTPNRRDVSAFRADSSTLARVSTMVASNRDIHHYTLW
jgi:hypothetical protein